MTLPQTATARRYLMKTWHKQKHQAEQALAHLPDPREATPDQQAKRNRIVQGINLINSKLAAADRAGWR